MTLTLAKDKTPSQREATRSFRDLQIQWNINSAEHFKLFTEKLLKHIGVVRQKYVSAQDKD